MEHAFRLTKGQDLKKEIEKYSKAHNISAGVIVCCVGCVDQYSLRLADGKSKITKIENMEIVSITGTISSNGCHIHISFSDVNGFVVGGHLIEGCLVNTTAEIVLWELEKHHFERAFDEMTGYYELVIHQS